MPVRIIDLIVGDSPDLYFAYDDCRIHRLSPNAYRDKYLLPRGHNTSLLLPVYFKSWDEAPRCFSALNRKLVYHENVSGLADIIQDFFMCEAYINAHKDVPIDTICVVVGGEVHHIIRTLSYIITLRSEDYITSQYTKPTKTKMYSYPCYPIVPYALRNLMAMVGKGDFTSTFKTYWLAWANIATSKEEDNMNDTVKPNIPYKAIQLFDTIDETSTYDRDVFVYSSSGIRRMSFSEYLHTIEAAHSGDYKMVKVWRTALSEIDQAHFDAIKKSTYNGRSGNRLGTIYMCFRALWFAATKELMSTTAWEDNK